MRFLNWKILLGLGLIGLSILLYAFNYLIFRDANYMFRLFLAQLGFLPISVLLVTIIISQLLSQRAKAAKLRKLNMVIGAFFSEVGTDLLSMFSSYIPKLADFRNEIKAIGSWSEQDIVDFQQRLRHLDFEIVMAAGDPETLCYFLLGKRDFLLRLLENPNLLEHDTFANLLLAVFHLTEELAHRRDLHHLTPGDREHLAGDIERAYVSLISEWLAYMRHLQKNYPYLFSLAWRTNPFDPRASAVIE
jgi:hypothetical protein